MMTIMFNKLKAEAADAIQANNSAKAHQIIGRIEMAYELGRLTWSQQDELTDMLLDALNFMPQ